MLTRLLLLTLPVIAPVLRALGLTLTVERETHGVQGDDGWMKYEVVGSPKYRLQRRKNLGW